MAAQGKVTILQRVARERNMDLGRVTAMRGLTDYLLTHETLFSSERFLLRRIREDLQEVVEDWREKTNTMLSIQRKHQRRQ